MHTHSHTSCTLIITNPVFLYTLWSLILANAVISCVLHVPDLTLPTMEFRMSHFSEEQRKISMALIYGNLGPGPGRGLNLWCTRVTALKMDGAFGVGLGWISVNIQ